MVDLDEQQYGAVICNLGHLQSRFGLWVSRARVISARQPAVLATRQRTTTTTTMKRHLFFVCRNCRLLLLFTEKEA